MKAGDRVPQIKLVSDGGDAVDLAAASARGKTIIYFYPKDDTPGCTREAQAFTLAAKDLKASGAKVYGISRDNTATHCKFRDKYKLNFPLLSDPDLAAHKAFGAWGEKTMYGKKVLGVIRSTFLVEDGKVSRAWGSVKVDGHVDAVLAAIAGEAGAKSSASKSPAKKAAKSASPKSAAKKSLPKAASKAGTKKSAPKKK